MAIQYVGSTKWTAVTAWAALTSYSVGDIRRQLAAVAAGNERVFRCTTAGTSLGSEPSWTLTAGGTTTEVAGPVWTEITGISTYNSPNNFAAPHARLRNAFAAGWMAAGDSAYVSNNHAATEAANVTLTSPGTAASPCHILCIDDTNATATLAATASEATTGTTNLAFAGFAYSYGLIYSCGNGASSITGAGFISSAPWYWVIEAGQLKFVNTSASTRWLVGLSGNATEDDCGLELINTTVSFGAVGQGFIIRCPFKWSATPTAIQGTVPTTLFLGATGNSGWAEIDDVDLIAIDTGNNLVDVAVAMFTRYTFRRCKLGSGYTAVTGANPSQGGPTVELINCDSGDTNYRYEFHGYPGSITPETTIVRTSGASDGTTTLAHKFVSSANSKLYFPLRGPWMSFWNETLGSVTLAIPVITDNVTLTDAEAWLEVEHLGTSGFPLGLVTNDRAASILATPANQATDGTSTWTTTGLTTPVKQTLGLAVTPAEKGMIRARVCLAKASTTMYVDPKLLSTSGRQYQGDAMYVNEGASGSSGGGYVIGA